METNDNNNNNETNGEELNDLLTLLPLGLGFMESAPGFQPAGREVPKTPVINLEIQFRY
jgi:hypothetical protein